MICITVTRLKEMLKKDLCGSHTNILTQVIKITTILTLQKL